MYRSELSVMEIKIEERFLQWENVMNMAVLHKDRWTM